METQILIVIMLATRINMQSSTKTDGHTMVAYQGCIDQAHHIDARHTPDKSQQPYAGQPTKNVICGLASKNPHEAGNAARRCTTQSRGGALDLHIADMAPYFP